MSWHVIAAQMYSPLLILAYLIPVPTLQNKGKTAVTVIHRKDSYGTFP